MRFLTAALAAAFLFASAPVGAETITPGGNAPPAVTFASLPTCNSTTSKGMRRRVSDSNTTTAGDTVAGGGANLVVVECNGTNWIVDVPGAAGGGSGDLTAITNSDGNLTITNGTGPAPVIDVGANIVLKNAGNTFGIGTVQNMIGAEFFPPASASCAPSANRLCIDTNGTTGLGGVTGVYDVSGTDYFLPSLTSAQIGTAGTKRALGIGTGNATETTLVTATPTASAIPLADGSGKLADGWLSALVSLLGQTIEIGEIAAGDKSGNGTDLATTAGAQTAGDCVEIDANGNHVASGDPCGTGAGSTLLAQASAPANPGAGTFTFWFDTIAEQIKAVLSDGTIHSLLRRQNGAITTGALLRWDGAQATEIPGASADGTTGIITAPGFVSTNNTAPQPKSHAFSTNACSTTTSGTVVSLQMMDPQAVCQNWSVGGTSALRTSGLPINQGRALNLRALTVNLYLWGAAGWEDEELFELVLYGCTLDASPAVADCTVIDQFLAENDTDGTADTLYGGSGANNRTAKLCANSGTTVEDCSLTWEIDGLGVTGSDGDPSVAAGAYQYLILGFNISNANFTADAATNPNSIIAGFVLDYEN